MRPGGVLVVGLDGGTLRILGPLARQGLMPAFQRIMSQGRMGTLRSTLPWYTIPGWTSLMTGVGPATHGLLYWVAAAPDDYFEDRRRGRRFLTSADIPFPTFWDVAGAAGKRVAVLNMPLTYPAWPVNGVMVTGLLTPRAASTGSCYPADLLARFPDYRADLSVSRAADSPDADVVEGVHLPSYLRELVELTVGRAAVGAALLAEDVDLGVVVFVGPDRISHKAWPQQVAVAAGAAPSGEIERLIREYYLALDRAMADLTAAAGPETTVVVVADHGFGPPPECTFAVNGWLRGAGYVKLRAAGAVRMRSWRRTLKRVARPVVRSLRRRRAAPSEASLVDWPRSAVYAVGYSRTRVFGLVVNRVGVKREGAVAPDSVPGLLRRLRDDLEALTDEQGRRVVRRIWERNDVGAAPGFPDLLVETEAPFIPSSGLLSTKLVELFPFPSGVHEPDGIFILSGLRLRGAGEVHADIVDVAPTVLGLLGISAPEYMEGKALDEFLHLPDQVPPPREVTGPSGTALEVPQEQLQEIEAHLRALGYAE